MNSNSKYPIDGAAEALWMATAVTAPATQPLTGSSRCDVVIVGAGITGLNAAHVLAAGGASVQVLEASHLGFGASGRSGGQVNVGLNETPSALIERFGADVGKRLVKTVVSAPDTVFDLIRQYQLDCDPSQNGWIQAAAGPGILKAQIAMAEDYVDHGAPFEVLNRDEVRTATGSYVYCGGLRCRIAGSVQPLSYTRELARISLDAGARIATDSPVTELVQQDHGWRVHTADARIDCDQVLICTNGYTGNLVASLNTTIVPVRSILVATEPLSERLRQTILPNAVTLVDKRRLILYFRYDRDGRLCIGDHGPMRDAFAMADFDQLKARVVSVFPQLANVRWDFHWGGRIAVTKNSLPFLHQIAPGLTAAMGYNGRGVGMGTVLGRVAGTALLDADTDPVFPVTQPDRFLLHRFHSLGANLHIKWYALMDYLDAKRH